MRVRTQIVAASFAVLLAVATTQPALALSAGKGNDYNGDGNGDLVAVNSVDHCLYRWNGNGAGTVVGTGGPDLCRQDGNNYDLAAVGDITGDGIGDVVTINRSTLCLFRWNGNPSGNFIVPHSIGCGWGPYAGSLAGAGDLNGDGNGDLVAVKASDNCMSWWPGNASGGFGDARGVGCGWGPYRGFITGVGDVTSDGRADLVAVNGDTGCLMLWAGNGAGGFGIAVQVGCGWGPYLPAVVGAGDLNRDGVGDLVAINRGDGCLYQWSGIGNGTFRNAIRLGCGWDRYVYSMAN